VVIDTRDHVIFSQHGPDVTETDLTGNKKAASLQRSVFSQGLSLKADR